MSSSTFKISTHVLDTNKGQPVINMSVKLYKLKAENEWTFISEGKTEVNGRFTNFSSDITGFTAATYKLSFDTKQYFIKANKNTFYPFIDIVFDVNNVEEHYHIPLLLNTYGYTTYRGS